MVSNSISPQTYVKLGVALGLLKWRQALIAQFPLYVMKGNDLQ